MIPTPRQVVILACLFAFSDAAATRAASVNVGTHFLAPNTSGQQVPILVTGGEPVSGVDLFVQVGDGGAAVGGDDTGPMITNLDLVTGTIFAGNNTGAFTDPTPLIWGATTTTTSGSIPANGLLATLTIDTTGILTGQFDLILNPPTTGPTAFADPSVITMLVNGSLRIGTAPFTPGDYNTNGVVDSADYIVWRKVLGDSGAGLAADGNGNGQIDAGDYDVWRAHFGRAAGASAAVAASICSTVPEPAPIWWLWLASCFALLSARRCNFGWRSMDSDQPRRQGPGF
jgi:hypothetical protein